MPSDGETRLRRRLRNIVSLLLVVAAVAGGVMLLRACAPSSAILEQRAAERAAWEKEQTAEQRASARAWHAAVRELQRQRGLMALVFLIGNIIVAAIIFRSTRANLVEMGARRRRLGEALLSLLRRGAAALGLAYAIEIAVPIMEIAIFGGSGMYSGEQMLAAIVTAGSFLLVWILSLGVASVVLWRRGRADAQ